MKFKALIIDDDEATLDMMRFRLEADGFAVTTADRGSTALEHIRDTEFDIVLTDFNLPDTNGIEIVRASKEVSRNRDHYDHGFRFGRQSDRSDQGGRVLLCRKAGQI
ncbi:MAG: response regulator [Acidobacteria bacterium]|nr:response regulator [Acidobacteriota bacterium]